MTRQAFISFNKRVVFFWSPKAGNTSLAEWFVQTTMRRRYHDAMRSIGFRTAVKANGYPDFRVAVDLIENLGFKAFALARDPYSRVVSAFVEKFLYSNRFGPIYGAAELERSRLIHQLASDSGNYSGITFRRFLEFVAERIAQRGGGEPRLNYHWNTQVPFFFRGRFSYPAIIHLERVDEEIGVAARLLGATAVPFPKRNATVEPNAPPDLDLSDVPSFEIVRSGLVPSVDNFMSPRCRSIVEEAYAIDFELLGYPLQGEGVSPLRPAEQLAPPSPLTPPSPR